VVVVAAVAQERQNVLFKPNQVQTACGNCGRVFSVDVDSYFKRNSIINFTQ